MTKQENIRADEAFQIRALMKMGANKLLIIERISTLHLKQLVYRLERIKNKSGFLERCILEFKRWLNNDKWWEVRESIIQNSIKDLSRPPLPSADHLLDDVKYQLDPKYKYISEQIDIIKACLYILLKDEHSEDTLINSLELIMLKTPLTIDHLSIINSHNSTQDRSDDLSRFIKALVDKNPNISSNEVKKEINIELQKLDSFIENIIDEEIEWTNKKGSVNEKIQSTKLSAISNRLTRIKKNKYR